MPFSGSGSHVRAAQLILNISTFSLYTCTFTIIITLHFPSSHHSIVASRYTVEIAVRFFIIAVFGYIYMLLNSFTHPSLNVDNQLPRYVVKEYGLISSGM
jgi:hypothetical protein